MLQAEMHRQASEFILIFHVTRMCDEAVHTIFLDCPTRQRYNAAITSSQQMQEFDHMDLGYPTTTK